MKRRLIQSPHFFEVSMPRIEDVTLQRSLRRDYLLHIHVEGPL